MAIGPKPEYFSVLQDDAFNQILPNLARIAPEARILPVRSQAINIITIQYMPALRYPMQHMFVDGGCTWWIGIVLRHKPMVLWGDVRNLKLTRHINGQLRRVDKLDDWYRWPHSKGYRGTQRRWNQNKRASTQRGGRLVAGHLMDVVRIPPITGDNGPRKLIS